MSRSCWLRGSTVALILALAGWPLTTGHYAQAAKVKTWYHQAPSAFDKAQLKQAVVSSEGAFRLSRQVKPLTGLSAVHVWDVVEDKDGNLFVATGDEGKVYKVAPDGKVTVAFESQESQVFCLALSPDGSVYAGTGPSGLVVRIGPDGNAKVIYDSPENYVWALAVDGKGETIYAATGSKGRIYKLTPEGKASVFYTTKQDHVLCLALASNGTLFAGTDKNGLVYRIDANGKGFVLYQAPQSEVRSLLWTPEGLYAATSVPSRKRSGGSTADAGSSSGSGVTATPASRPVSTEAKPAAEGDAKADAPKPDPAKDKPIPAAAAAAPGAGENSVYRIGFDGTVRELFRDKAMIRCILRQDGKLFVGTGMEGQLFEVNEATKERSEIARLDHGQVHCLAKRQDGSIVLGTGDPGKLYTLQDKYAEKGTILSDVLDAKLLSKWGALRWKAVLPPGTSATVACRAGNLAEPDETWSDWSDEQADPEQARIACPPGRFLQYRVTLASTNPAVSPSVSGIALRYQTSNQSPEVSAVDVPDLDAVVLDNPKKLKIKWTATDPNEDELTYSLYVRKDGWKSWVQLEDSLTKTEYEWDTATTPAGMYQVKVVASDHKDNSAEEALTGERLSNALAVAHVPPTVTVKVVAMEGDLAVVEASAVDPLVRLTSASFAVNGKKWINVFPTDGLFDSKQETFRFTTEALRPGTHVLVLRVKDAAGNIGSGDTVFTVQTKAK